MIIIGIHWEKLISISYRKPMREFICDTSHIIAFTPGPNHSLILLTHYISPVNTIFLFTYLFHRNYLIISLPVSLEISIIDHFQIISLLSFSVYNDWFVLHLVVMDDCSGLLVYIARYSIYSGQLATSDQEHTQHVAH